MWIPKTSSFRTEFPLASTSSTASLFQKSVSTETGKTRKVAEYTELIKTLAAKPSDYSYKDTSITGIAKYRTMQITKPNQLQQEHIKLPWITTAREANPKCLSFFLLKARCVMQLEGCRFTATGKNIFFVSQPWLQGQQRLALLAWLEQAELS